MQSGMQTEPFAAHFAKSRAPGEAGGEIRCPYFSSSGHVVLAELCLSLSQPGGKLLPPRVAESPRRGAGAVPGAAPSLESSD